MDLLSRVIFVKGKEAPPQEEARRTPPKWWARAIHALLLRAVGEEDPALAESLHNASSLRPFSLSSLRAYSPREGIQEGKRYSFRLCGINKALSTAISQSKLLQEGAEIDLDGFPFVISAPEKAGNWAQASDYTALSAPYLAAKKRAPRQISLRFSSPVAFKTQGSHLPLPLPGLVFGSLLMRWNAFAPIHFPPELRLYAEKSLVISRYSLESRVISAKNGALRIGGVGKVRYTCTHYDAYWMSLIALLADFSLFSGVGSGLSLGMGQTKRIFAF